MPTIIADSREQRWDHVKNYFDRTGQKWIRSKLPCGDYGRMDNLTVVVDRKQSLNEVEGNLIQQHERFKRECKLAQDNGIRLIVLVESGTCRTLDDVCRWQNPRLKRWMMIDEMHSKGKALSTKIPARPPVSGKQLHSIMQTMQEKYGVEWRFCLHQNCGETICRILGITPEKSSAE